MTRKEKPEQVIMYLADEEQKKVWEVVKKSFGAGLSLSALLYKLVHDRYYEITDGQTKRQVGKETLLIVKEQSQKLNLLLDAHGIEWDEFRNCDNPPGSE